MFCGEQCGICNYDNHVTQEHKGVVTICVGDQNEVIDPKSFEFLQEITLKVRLDGNTWHQNGKPHFYGHVVSVTCEEKANVESGDNTQARKGDKSPQSVEGPFEPVS